jgi:Zn ribbon nucleic-acid-binding protein
MEVLEHGWAYNEKNGIIECNKCGCKYKFDKKDVKKRPKLLMDYDCDWLYYGVNCVKCPECEEVREIGELKSITRREYESLKGVW